MTRPAYEKKPMMFSHEGDGAPVSFSDERKWESECKCATREWRRLHRELSSLDPVLGGICYDQ